MGGNAQRVWPGTNGRERRRNVWSSDRKQWCVLVLDEHREQLLRALALATAVVRGAAVQLSRSCLPENTCFKVHSNLNSISALTSVCPHTSMFLPSPQSIRHASFHHFIRKTNFNTNKKFDFFLIYFSVWFTIADSFCFPFVI